ncbi:aspartate kinase [Liberiplasma polymorphum]|uniref:aspartate kinase n=1 Tax=Liberiplasma polymorphum TaxID=3374570 RepID=UPI003773C910
MVVLKFGGSSLETVEKMHLVADKIIERKTVEKAIVVVVSAMGKTTNMLLELAQSASMNPSKREMDMLLSTGEQVSTALLSMILTEKGVDSIALNGLQAGIQTEGIHMKNKIKDIEIEKINYHLNLGRIVVVTGFQGVNLTGDITTLGRGGSDTTAVAIAAKLNCKCEIYTDVTGIYGVNPRVYKQAKKLETVSYEEMSELAFLGAKVMEPRAVEIGQKYGVEIYVASAHENVQGTWIKEVPNMLEQRSITGVSVIDRVAMITINHYPRTSASVAEMFIRLAENEVNIDMISQTLLTDGLVNISFTCDVDDLRTVYDVLTTLKGLFPDFEILQDTSVSKVSVVGIGMRSQSGVAAKIFKLFADNSIPFKLVTTSEISISYTIPNEAIAKTVSLLGETFEL